MRRVTESTSFNLGGSIRTYWEVYLGFGLSISALLLAQTIVLWLLARADVQRPGENRDIVAAMLVGNILLIGLAMRCLFAAPVITMVLIAAPLAVELVTIGRDQAQARQSPTPAAQS